MRDGARAPNARRRESRRRENDLRDELDDRDRYWQQQRCQQDRENHERSHKFILLMFVARSLNRVSESAADDGAGERMLVIDERTGNRADCGAARAAVVMMLVMLGLRERTSGRQREHKAEDGRLNFRLGRGGHS